MAYNRSGRGVIYSDNEMGVRRGGLRVVNVPKLSFAGMDESPEWGLFA
jgi:hypothetical protein